MKPDTAPVSSLEKLSIRNVTAVDLAAVAKLDEAITGQAKPHYWRELLFCLEQCNKQDPIFLVAELDGRIIGYIAGNVRAFEFGCRALRLGLCAGGRPRRQGQQRRERGCSRSCAAASSWQAWRRSGPCFRGTTIWYLLSSAALE